MDNKMLVSTRQLSLVMLAFDCQEKVDIVFLLDSSGSVGGDNFNKMKQFLVESISGFTIGPNSIQIGLVTFSEATTQFNLNQFSSVSAVQNGIKTVPYHGGGTYTSVALRYVGSHSFNKSAGDRENTPDLLVVITDGHSNNPVRTKGEADILKKRGINIMAIGIGSGVKMTELLNIASNSSLVIEVNNFDALSSTLANTIHSMYCQAGETITSTTTTTTTTTTIPPTTTTSSTSTATTSTTTPSQTTIIATSSTTSTKTTPTTQTTSSPIPSTQITPTPIPTTQTTPTPIPTTQTTPTPIPTTQTTSSPIPSTQITPTPIPTTQTTPTPIPTTQTTSSPIPSTQITPTPIPTTQTTPTPIPTTQTTSSPIPSTQTTPISIPTTQTTPTLIPSTQTTSPFPSTQTTPTTTASTTHTATTVTTPTTRTSSSSTTSITTKATTSKTTTLTTTTAISNPITSTTPTTTTMHASTTSFATDNPQDLPVVKIPHQKHTTSYGQPVEIVCNVTSPRYPILEVFWEEFDNGITTRIDRKTSGIEGVTISNPSLTIKKPMVNSTYTCKARNAVGTRSSTEFYLIVKGGPPTVTVQIPRNSTIIYGSPVVLNCTVHSFLNITAIYLKAFYDYDRQNAKIIHEGEFNTAGITIDNPSLTLNSPTFHDTGEYLCYARNEAGQTLSRRIPVKVDGGIPEVHIGSTSYTVKYGHKVTLNCTVVKASPPLLEVYWILETYKGKTIIRHGESGTSGSTTNNPSLTINSTTTTDPGKYTCIAVNAVGNGSSQVTVLKVIGGVPQVTVDSKNYISIFGDNVTLKCSVKSDPPHTNVYWKHSNDGRNTSNLNQRATGTEGITLQNPSLIIGKTNFAHSGYYTCVASNEIGEGNSESIYLNVTGDYPNVSASPFQYTVDYSNNVTLYCKINATPRHYEVYWLQHIHSNFTRKISSQTLTSSGSTLKIKEITSSANYSCVAVNAVGQGQSSIINLTVLGGIPKVKRQKLKYKTGKGYSVTINCIVKSEHLKILDVSWSVYNPRTNKTNEIHNGEVGIDGVSPDNPSLIINEVSVSMEGEYTCCAINKAGDACGLPSDLIVETNFKQTQDKDGNSVEKTALIAGIIVSILSIITTLVTAVCKRKKLKGCLQGNDPESSNTSDPKNGQGKQNSTNKAQDKSKKLQTISNLNDTSDNKDTTRLMDNDNNATSV